MEGPEGSSERWRLLFSKAVVYGVFFGILTFSMYVVWAIDISFSADVSLSLPLQILAWVLVIFMTMVLIGSYARVFGMKFLTGLIDFFIELIDNYERR